ncbi:amino acid ABC transporter permease [Lacticaseibacillus pantheris]|uniref:Amino acid ABC transporter, amino acid-binding permease protein n=1 Tax=Lacticaseibacillus pantheris DSM 15945 = JCM 12539 = NBRC 106106 TaxID=1423783 RepID=A0A0R1U3U0_9LACO|nr:amino acid ABC transporter permease [Lacticaseibacillus pantheris]KRL85923.1 amino acid ABC transporter, amino acid-binding permease protein [Lacticaseibacillus pantheris DSM 15945 = JCM 12539 = NBRC 106106]
MANFFSGFSFLKNYWQFFVTGVEVTIELAIVSIILGTVLGIMLAMAKRSKAWILSLLSKAFIGFIRDTPLLAQIYIVYIALPAVTGLSVPDFVTGAVALTLYSSAYIAEIIRSGIQSLPAGQSEAAASLGMTSRQAMRDIILPQAFKNILPALGNQFIGNVKDSSLVSVLGITDLMYQAQTVRGSTALGLQPILVASGLYLIMTWLLNRVLSYGERRMSVSDNR